MIEAQRIACHNRAWVVMSFAAQTDGFTTPETGSMAIGQTQVIDLANYPMPEGLAFIPTWSSRRTSVRRRLPRRRLSRSG